MKTTIDAAGRVVVPKKIREAVQLEPGSELEVRVENGVMSWTPKSGMRNLTAARGGSG